MTTYFQLWCVDCNEEFKPLVCTNRGELLSPDYGNTEGGVSNLGALEKFHLTHRGHRLEEREFKPEWLN